MKKDWEEYKTLVIPPQAEYAQLRETKLAFYSGAYAALGNVLTRPENIEEIYREVVRVLGEMNPLIRKMHPELFPED